MILLYHNFCWEFFFSALNFEIVFQKRNSFTVLISIVQSIRTVIKILKASMPKIEVSLVIIFSSMNFLIFLF